MLYDYFHYDFPIHKVPFVYKPYILQLLNEQHSYLQITTMSDTSCNIEQDITDAYHCSTSTLVASSSSTSTIIDRQPSYQEAPDYSNMNSTFDHAVPSIKITTVPSLAVNILWVQETSRRVKVGSFVQINGEDEIYEVIGMLNREGKKRTITCMAKNGHTIGLVIDPEDFEMPWVEIVKRHLPLIFC